MGQKHSRDEPAQAPPKRRAPDVVDLTGMLPFEIWTTVFWFLTEPLDRDALSLTCRYMLCVRRSGVRVLVINADRVRVTDRIAAALRHTATAMLEPDASAPFAYPRLMCVAVYWGHAHLAAGSRSRDVLAPLYLAGCVVSAARRAGGHTVLELSNMLSDLSRLFVHMTPRAMNVLCSFAVVRVLPDYPMVLRFMKYMDKWCESHQYCAPWPAFCVIWRKTQEDEHVALVNRLDSRVVQAKTCTIAREPLFAVAPLPEGEGSRHQQAYHALLRHKLYLRPVEHTPTTDWPRLRAKQAQHWMRYRESD